MDETKKKLYVERDGFCTEASMLLMALAIVFRLIGSIGRWEDTRYLLTQVALPVFSGLLFLLCLLFLGKKAFWSTVIPVVLGVVFFIFRIMGVENEWQMVGCIVLYVVLAVLYAMSFSIPKLKWALAGILALAFLYHVIEDIPELMNLENPVSFVDGMQEMSVLGVMLSLFCVSIAMRYPGKAPAPEQPKPVPEQPKPAPEQPLKPAALAELQQTAAQPESPREEPQPAEEPLPAASPVPVQELEWAAEPAPAFPLDEDIPAGQQTEEGTEAERP